MSALDDKIDDLVGSVNAESTVIDSAIAFINGVPGLIQAAKDAALAAGATQTQLASLTSLKSTLDAKSTDLQAALTINTEPPPPPPPPPPPAPTPLLVFVDDRGSLLTAMSMTVNDTETVKIQINGTPEDTPEWNVEADNIQLFPSSDGLSAEVSASAAGASAITIKAKLNGGLVIGRLPVTVTA